MMRVAFGGSDPESEAGKRVLDALGIEWVQATVSGRPVDGRTAYECDPIAGVTHWFECAPRGAPAGSSQQARPCSVCGDWPLPGSTWAGTWDRGPNGEAIWGGLGTCGDAHQWGVVLDHHRAGDPGFGHAPSEFLRASSIGQLVSALASTGVDIPSWTLDPGPAWRYPYWPGVQRVFAGDHRIFVRAPSAPPNEWMHCRVVPDDILCAAAADHCLAAAYRGDCPGVEPDALMQWRAASRAAFQRRDVADVLRDINVARAALIAAPRITIGRPLGCVDGYCVHIGTLPPSHPDCGCGQVVVDLRGVHVPELPEAQARLGVSVICDGLPGRDGRAKVNLMGTESACRAFLGSLDVLGCDPTSGYGDPSRGIVGAYRATA